MTVKASYSLSGGVTPGVAILVTCYVQAGFYKVTECNSMSLRCTEVPSVPDWLT